MDLTQYVAASGIVGLFAASAIVLFRSMKYEASITHRFQKQIDDLQEDLAISAAERTKCAKANSVLINTLQRNGIEIPKEGWL